MQSDTSPFGFRGYLIDAPEFGALRGRPNGAVLIEKGKIADVGDYDDLRRLRPNIQWADRRPAAIFPGLIDCHTHLPQYSAVAAKASCCPGCANTSSRSSAISRDRKRASKRRNFFTSWCVTEPQPLWPSPQSTKTAARSDSKPRGTAASEQ